MTTDEHYRYIYEQVFAYCAEHPLERVDAIMDWLVGPEGELPNYFWQPEDCVRNSCYCTEETK